MSRRRLILPLLVALVGSSRGDVSLEALLGGVVQPTAPQPIFALEASDNKFVIGLETHPHSADDEAYTGQSGVEEAVEIVDHSGKRFVCVFPKDVPEASGASEARDEQDKGAHNITELLSPLSTGCYYRVDGWWTYEFCHRKSIRQFHQEKDVVTSEFYLGYFDGTEASEHRPGGSAASLVSEAVSATGGTQRFYAHNFTNGTECELTGERRSTEVRFVCSPEAGTGVVESINEHPTCHYVLNFASSLLCNHSAFSPEPPQVHHIRCNLVGGSGAGALEVEGGAGAAGAGTGAGDAKAAPAGGAGGGVRGGGAAEGQQSGGTVADRQQASAGDGDRGSGHAAAKGAGGEVAGGDDPDEDEEEEAAAAEVQESLAEILELLQRLGQRGGIGDDDDEPDDDL